ncbi:MAG TPA: hypothetical protein VLJ18_03200 [Thermoanaerobaculia bacterium]|nr:hypothetical protein [Thermoanaerobaculia bacterium]
MSGRLALLLLVTLAGSAAAHPGIGIVRDGRGNVFYTDLANVWRIDPAGVKTIAVARVHTHELWLDASGALYGEHLWYEGDATKKWGHRVWRLGPDGSLSDVVAAREGFRTDWSFVRDAAGNGYWREGDGVARFFVKTAAGATAVRAECFDCRDVRWLAAARDGTLYFVDGADLRAVSPQGSIRTLARGLGSRSLTQAFVSVRHALMGIWTGPGGVYVARYGTREVLVVAPDGVVTVAARSSFPWAPTGGTFGPEGDLWLLEASATDAVRVRRIARDGRVTVY